MNPKTLVDALLGFIITFGTSVGALLAQNGVGSLADVSSAAWWAALAGALVATAKTVQSRLADPSAADAKSNPEAGFVKPPLLYSLGALAAGVLAIHLVACSYQLKPNNAIAAASLSIEQMATEIGTAQKLGQISVEREHELLERLQDANNQLRAVQVVLAGCTPNCTSTDDELANIAAMLVTLRNDLAVGEKQP